MKTKIHPKQVVFRGPSIKELTVQLCFEPIDENIFIEALTHSSYANEHALPSNERLEFLGDSILSLVVCRFLFLKYPVSQEGELAKLKSVIVSAPILAAFAKRLNLSLYIRLGQGELRTNGKEKQNILADLFEAFIGAFF